MDQAHSGISQTGIPKTGIPADNQDKGAGVGNSNKKDAGLNDKGKESAGKEQANDEIQLADVLKPSTLITALVALVLFILLGWYFYVLKPALNDNESMIHFMERVNNEPAALAHTSNNTSASQAGSETNQAVKTNKVDSTVSGIAQDSENKTASLKVHNTRRNTHSHKSSARQITSSANKSKCTQAQIALQQCH